METHESAVTDSLQIRVIHRFVGSSGSTDESFKAPARQIVSRRCDSEGIAISLTGLPLHRQDYSVTQTLLARQTRKWRSAHALSAAAEKRQPVRSYSESLIGQPAQHPPIVGIKEDVIDMIALFTDKMLVFRHQRIKVLGATEGQDLQLTLAN